jgi:hypothetical protein
MKITNTPRDSGPAWRKHGQMECMNPDIKWFEVCTATVDGKPLGRPVKPKQTPEELHKEKVAILTTHLDQAEAQLTYLRTLYDSNYPILRSAEAKVIRLQKRLANT